MDLTGQDISHYRILEKLGRGGMGEVYRADDTRLRRSGALKFLPPELTADAAARSRFINEAQSASSLRHQNTCAIHEIDQSADGRMFICMEYRGGQTLKTRGDRGPLPVSESRRVAIQMADGLARAHENGVVHRDVKPANVALTTDHVVKVLDFGLARLGDRSRLTRAGTTVETGAGVAVARRPRRGPRGPDPGRPGRTVTSPV